VLSFLADAPRGGYRDFLMTFLNLRAKAVRAGVVAAIVIAAGACHDPSAPGEITVRLDGKLERSMTVTANVTQKGVAIPSSDYTLAAQPATNATISADGTIKLLKSGSLTITATVGSVTGSTTVTVNQPPLIVFDMQDNVSRQIWQVAIDGGDLVQLTTTGPDNQHPSRVGNKLVYAGARNGRTFDLFMMNLSNNSESQLTSTNAAERDPYLSPNGNRIVYVSDAGGLDRAIYSNADGTGAAFVTDNSSNTGAIEISPAWSPASDRVIFSSTAFNGSPDIYLATSFGTLATRLPVAVNTSDTEASPVWSSSNVIAYLTTRSGDSQIWTTDPSGNNPAFLVAGGMPAWLPDGRLVFVRFSNAGTGSLFWVDPADKSVVHPIDVGGRNAQRPAAVLP